MTDDSNVAVRAAPMSAKATHTVGVVRISPSLTAYWTMIARDRSEEARAVAARTISSDMVPETLASMIAVSASAHALDALDGALAPLVSATGSRRHSIILERIKQGFRVGAKQHLWLPEFAWLFDLRDAAVHDEQDFWETVEHPRLPTHVAPEIANFSAESAERVYQLLEDVLLTCVHGAKSTTSDWANTHRELLVKVINSEV